ncbi:MAG: AIPR family protein [Gammaproteobacteria bacterium]|nr:AIPR family protein [Gammaproteobacteria bacterium]
MSKTLSARSSAPFHFPYYSFRNISSPEDLDNGRRIYVGQAPISSILDLPTDENVRDYLLDAEGKNRRVPTQVHRAIRDTLENDPDSFSVLNGGTVLVARTCEVNDKQKIVLLNKASIINGSQTQGVIRDFLEQLNEQSRDEFLKRNIKYELIVTNNEGLIADVSIARNFQNDVMTISIAGRLGQLDELEASFSAKTPGAKLKKSETKLSNDYVKTERLIQVITALIPKELWVKSGDFNKVYAYNMKTKCLKEFQEIYKRAKDSEHSEHEKYSDLYQFYLDISAEAWKYYQKWKTHSGFEGSRIRSIERDGRTIREVPDGIIFPILASLSAFAKKEDTGWTIKSPDSFSDEELIRAAKSVYQDIANSTPGIMGKSKACYSALYQITEIYQRLSENN